MLQRILQFRLFIAVVTFAVGVTVATLFLVANRPYDGENIPTYFEKENLRPNLIDVELRTECQLPPVKALYSSLIGSDLDSMDIAIFYADGSWGSVASEGEGVYLGGDKFFFSTSAQYYASVGTWTEAQDGVMVTEEEGHYFLDQGFAEAESDRLMRQKRWELVKGVFGKPGSVLKLKYQIPNWTYTERGEKAVERKPLEVITIIYQFQPPEEIGDIKGVLSAPLWVKDSHKFLPVDNFE